MATKEAKASRLRRSTRWGLLAVALLLGLGLIGAALLNYREAHELAPVLSRGQAESYLRSFRERSRPEYGPPSRNVLDSVLTEHHSSGLRYVALVDRDGQIELAAGQSPFEGRRPIPAEDRPEYVEGVVRVMVPPPPLPPPPPPHPYWPPPPPPDADSPTFERGGPPLPGPPWAARLLIEFEPVSAHQLIAGATQSLIISILTALGLMLAAAVLWRLLVRADRAEAELAQQQHLATLGEMSAVLAHEIRNPLAAVKGHAQLLAEQLPSGDRQRDRVEVIVDEVGRLEKLTTQLLDFSRSGTVDREPVSPAALLEQAVERVDAERIDLDTADAPERWSLDPLRVGQVLENLLQNALQASPDDARVSASAQERDGSLIYTVRDRGPGIAAAQLDRIFDPFVTSRTRGTGLGLAVARRIVELHHGRIEAESRSDGGATFRVRFPAE